jgi:SHS2 domain-containing protein
MNDYPVVPGVRAIEHTADLAIEVEAGSLGQLFDRAARGMLALIERGGTGRAEGEEPARRSPERVQHNIELEAEDLAVLLVLWLREILYLYQGHDLAYRGAEVEIIDQRRLRARVRAEAAPGEVERELKGVTYHDLEVAREEGGWRARLIFDV